MRIFLAGASGAVGKRLVSLLVTNGVDVVGTTRSPAKAEAIATAGATPVVVDVFDEAALLKAVIAARPEIVIHQLTDLPPSLDPARMAEATGRNARLRDVGTRHLIAASKAANARRLIAQSIAWMYAAGTEPYGEGDPLDLSAEGARAVTVGGVVSLEQQVLNAAPIAGIVLRYGQFYGPGTGFDAPRGPAPLHVDAAAWAAFLAIEKARPGIYNVAETDQLVSSAKARRDLGWDPGLRVSTVR